MKNKNRNKIYLKQLNKALFLSTKRDIRIKEIMMEKLYVTIYGIMVFKYQNNGRMSNIRILKEINMEIEHKHFMMLWME